MENQKENYCTIYLVRHGETEWNVKHIIQGQSNSNLTENGKSQAQETAKEFENIKFDAIFSSDSFRAQNTAEIIKLDRELLIQTSELLRERNFGSFEGRPAKDFEDAFKEKLEKRLKLTEGENWVYKVSEDVESDEEVVSRFITKIREISVAYPNKTVLVVSHGGPIRMFLAKTGYLSKKDLPGGSFKNAGYVKVLSDGIDFFIEEVKGVDKTKN